jgi:FkbM family methyltransferase
MLRVALRLLGFSQRFTVGISNFGLLGALKLFLLYRSRSLTEPTSVYIRKMRRTFHYRGSADWGVMSHFYKDGYRIRDDRSDTKVKFIIDAGANIGDETARFRFFHPGARIVAIEAEKANYEMLQRNTEGDINCFSLNRGLWSKVCGLKVISGIGNEGYRVVEVDDASEDFDVLATSIDQVMQDYGVSEIDILKLDIEGSEKQVFDASTDGWLGKVKVYVFECPDNDEPGTTMLIFRKLLQSGLEYNCYLHGENMILVRHDVDWEVSNDLILEK